MAARVEIEIDPLALKQARHGKTAICRNRYVIGQQNRVYLHNEPAA